LKKCAAPEELCHTWKNVPHLEKYVALQKRAAVEKCAALEKMCCT